MTPDEFWEHEFGHSQYERDFAGKQIMKGAYKDDSNYQWDLDHILPLKLKKEGKPDNINNWQIVHVETNRQKADNNPFIINNKKYQIKKVKNLYEEDIVAPYPYERNGKILYNYYGGKHMKIKTIGLVIIICFAITSCETLGINLENTFSSSQSNSSNSSSQNNRSQNRTTVAPSQPTQNDPNRRADPDAVNWDIATLDTAANVDYLTGIEKDVILEMNKVRTNPKKYAELYIQPRLRYFSGKNYSVPGQITIVTEEGAAAVNGCITALNRANSVSILTPERGLSLAAKDHVTDQSRTGQTGHDGSDRSTPEIRMKRYGVFSGSWTLGENIAYGDTTGREIVCSLLIDDGVPSRGHRTNIMNRAFTQTGVGYGTHTQYRTSCTITYANGYSSN